MHSVCTAGSSFGVDMTLNIEVIKCTIKYNHWLSYQSLQLACDGPIHNQSVIVSVLDQDTHYNIVRTVMASCREKMVFSYSEKSISVDTPYREIVFRWFFIIDNLKLSWHRKCIFLKKLDGSSILFSLYFLLFYFCRIPWDI